MAIQNNTNPFATFDEERKNRYMQMTGQSAPTLQVPKAEDAYREAFPQRETSMSVPKMEAPEKNYKYADVRNEDYTFSTPKSFNPEEYKDGTADGLARNYFSKTFKPKTEEDYSRDNETTKRILALGDALRHIGNIVSTTNGAPAQKFNDPVALKEQQYQTERAHRETQAYKQAQQEYQRDKLNTDRNYKNFVLQMKLYKAKSDAERNKILDDFKKEQFRWRKENAADVLAYRKQKDAEDRKFRKQVHADQVANQKANRELRWEIHNSSRGGGSGHDKPIIPTKDGYMSRRTVLNSQDLQSLWRDMDEMKLLTPAKKEEYQRAYVSGGSAANNVIRGSIAWASRHVPEFREHLKKHYGFSEVTTTSRANQGNGTSQSSQSTAKPTQPKVTQKEIRTTVKAAKKEEKKKVVKQNQVEDDIDFIITGK